MLNPNLNKTIIINPDETMAENLTILNPIKLLEEVVLKATAGSNKTFTPIVTNDKHLKVFMSNVTPVRKAIQNYTGAELNTLEEAMEFFAKAGRELIGPTFALELVKHEIQLGKATAYGLYTTDETETVQVAKVFDGFCAYVINPVIKKDAKKNNKKETKEAKEGTDNE